MFQKKYALIWITVFFFFASLLAQTPQEKKGPLEPESFNEARLNRLQPPDQVMDAIGLEPGMVVAEIGAGRGRYVMHLAARVGESGRVYAEDINAASLDHLKKRCAKWGISNVEIILGDVTDPKLPEAELDLIFVISSYHHFDDPVALMRNARPALKPNGTLVVLEWLPKNEKDTESTTPEKIEAQMKAAGYKFERTETFLKANRIYIYIFRIDDAPQK